jgi:pimeloyl-ACP methyl ester carboxylesterase
VDFRTYDGTSAIMNVIVKTAAVVSLSSLAVGANCLEILPSADSSMHTEGHGPVTIVFEAGLGDTGKVWRSVQASVADHCARTVSYTRRGYGIGSNASDGPRDAERIVAELRWRLAASGLSPPYVLVGHSLGGLYMQYFARRYPEEVQGLVLVDSMHSKQLGRVKAKTPGVYRMMNVVTVVMGGAMRREFVGIPATSAEIEALPEAFKVPTIVLSSTRPAAGEKPEFRALLAQLQIELADSYAARRHDFVPDSGHYIQRDQPQVVINAVRELARCDTQGVPLQSTHR